MAKKARHPVARIRATVAGIDLFFPKASAVGKRRKLKKFLKRIAVGSPAELKQLKYRRMGATTHRDRFLRMRVFGTKAGLRSKRLVLHELIHFFKLGKNDSLTANAIDGYFRRIKYTRTMVEFTPDGIQTMNEYKPWLRDAEQIIRGPKYLKKDRYEHDKESDLGHAGTAIAPIGLYLGAFAADKEREWQKPASGLFLMREVCNGMAVDAAIKKIESGKLDQEIKVFARKHLANLLSKAR